VHLPFMPVMELMEAWAGAVGEALVAAEVPLAVFSSSGPVPTGDVGVVTFDSKGGGGPHPARLGSADSCSSSRPSTSAT
jgi:hypothetical protein